MSDSTRENEGLTRPLVNNIGEARDPNPPSADQYAERRGDNLLGDDPRDVETATEREDEYESEVSPLGDHFSRRIDD